MINPRRPEEEISENDLVRENIGLVRLVCRRWASRWDHDDIFQSALTGLLMAGRKFSHARGIPWSSFAFMTIRQAVGLYFQGDCRHNRLPTISIDAPQSLDEPDGTLHDLIADPRSNPEDEALGRIQLEMILKAIHEPRSRLVLACRLDGLSLEAVGKRLGRTRERVRQIQNKALEEVSSAGVI
jgi:RNA polymerase sigma factor (sigma-70 family)